MTVHIAGRSHFLPNEIVCLPDTGEVVRVTSIKHWRVGWLAMSGRRPQQQRRRWGTPKIRGEITVARRH